MLLLKNADFLQKMLALAKLIEPLYEKVYFLKLNMSVYLRTKFQASNIFLLNFRQRGEGGF